MAWNRIGNWSTLGLLACGALSLAATGCQTTIGGQTLPSAYYLHDDIQYFPAGPEFKLANQAEAFERYRLEQHGALGPPPPPFP